MVTDYSKGTHSFGRIFTVDETARAYEMEAEKYIYRVYKYAL